MSKIHKWLWIVIGLETVAIAALIVWGTAFKPAPPPAPAPKKTVQKTQPAYKPPQLALTKVVDGLNKVTTVTTMPDQSDKRLFITEQDGDVRILNGDGKLDPNLFLDIKSEVQSDAEMGLLGLAFHPKIAQNGYVFVDYVDKGQNTIISRFKLNKTTGLADKSTEKVLLKIKQPYTNHKGGQLAFGPDGDLYIGMGDGGNGGDPENRAQDKNQLLGKILRVNVDGENLAIPADNPFVNGGGKPEIWALGLRNPWRFSFDRKTGDLYIADVGQEKYEEVNFVAAKTGSGSNYGWRCYEGAHPFNPAGCQDAANYTAPVLEYDHTEKRCSIIGGYVYRGTKYPAMAGKYFFADYCGGQIYYAGKSGTTWTQTLAAQTAPSTTISAFGEDNNGELYVADRTSNALYHLEDIAN